VCVSRDITTGQTPPTRRESNNMCGVTHPYIPIFLCVLCIRRAPVDVFGLSDQPNYRRRRAERVSTKMCAEITSVVNIFPTSIWAPPAMYCSILTQWNIIENKLQLKIIVFLFCWNCREFSKNQLYHNIRYALFSSDKSPAHPMRGLRKVYKNTFRARGKRNSRETLKVPKITDIFKLYSHFSPFFGIFICANYIHTIT